MNRLIQLVRAYFRCLVITLEHKATEGVIIEALTHKFQIQLIQLRLNR